MTSAGVADRIASLRAAEARAVLLVLAAEDEGLVAAAVARVTAIRGRL
jgi:hypothetical protein